MYDPKFSQKQMYDQYGSSRKTTTKTDPKPSRSSGFSGMGSDPAERFGGSPTRGLGSRPFDRGSTYDEVPTPAPRKPEAPSNIEKVKDKFVDLMRFFGAEDPKEEKVDGKAVYKGPMFTNTPIDIDAQMARIRDAVDYSKAPPPVYTAYGSTYDTVPPVNTNKDRVKNAVNAFLKQRGLGGKEYTIKRGDTLSEIAQREGVAIDDLAKINKIENINRILAGETLIIPPPQEMERAKDIVDSVDPDAQFYQSGVPLDQRIFEPELGYDEVPQVLTQGLMSPPPRPVDAITAATEALTNKFYDNIGTYAEGDHGDTPVQSNDEGAADDDLDVAYGHKLKQSEKDSGMIHGIKFQNEDGTYIPLTEAQKREILKKDFEVETNLARSKGWDRKLKARGSSWDELDYKYKNALSSLAMNVGGTKAGEQWNKVFDAAIAKDPKAFAKEMRRTRKVRQADGCLKDVVDEAMDNRVAKELYYAGIISNLSEVSDVLTEATAGSGVPQ